MKIKIKDIVKLPEKEIAWRDATDYAAGEKPLTAFIEDKEVVGANRTIDQIGNINIELDVGKIEVILNQDLPYLENSKDGCDVVLASIIRNNNKAYAKIIADNFKEIVK